MWKNNKKLWDVICYQNDRILVLSRKLNSSKQSLSCGKQNLIFNDQINSSLNQIYLFLIVTHILGAKIAFRI